MPTPFIPYCILIPFLMNSSPQQKNILKILLNKPEESSSLLNSPLISFISILLRKKEVSPWSFFSTNFSLILRLWPPMSQCQHTGWQWPNCLLLAFYPCFPWPPQELKMTTSFLPLLFRACGSTLIWNVSRIHTKRGSLYGLMGIPKLLCWNILTTE